MFVSIYFIIHYLFLFNIFTHLWPACHLGHDSPEMRLVFGLCLPLSDFFSHVVFRVEIQGETGSKGDSGEPGLNGLPGMKGDIGDPGLTGPMVREDFWFHCVS